MTWDWGDGLVGKMCVVHSCMDTHMHTHKHMQVTCNPASQRETTSYLGCALAAICKHFVEAPPGGRV